MSEKQGQDHLDYGIDAITSSSGSGVNLNFTLDLRGNPTQVTRGGVVNTFEYDELGRLETTIDPTARWPIETYTYDATGNRLSKTVGAGSPQSYGYPVDRHRLTSIAGQTRLYDDVGNLVDRDDGKDFAYSDANRLETVAPQVPIPGVTVTAAYRYSAKGERVAKTFVEDPARDRYFSFDETGRLLSEYGLNPVIDPCACFGEFCGGLPPYCEEDPPESKFFGGGDAGRSSKSLTGHRQYEYIWLDDLPVAVVYGDKLFYVEPDHLGTPRVVAKPSSNTAIWTWDLINNPFGEAAPNEDPDANTQAFVFNLRYPGQYFDQETGLHYNYFRDYDPSTGRYIESDPIGLGGGISTYSYAKNQAISNTDPLGLFGTYGGIVNPFQVRCLGSMHVDCLRPYSPPPSHLNCFEACVIRGAASQVVQDIAVGSAVYGTVRALPPKVGVSAALIVHSARTGWFIPANTLRKVYLLGSLCERECKPGQCP